MDEKKQQLKPEKGQTPLCPFPKAIIMAKDRNSSDDKYEEFIRELRSQVIASSCNKQVPEFPMSYFPTKIQAFIQEAKDSLNYPIDFTASSILFACSLATGKSRKISVKKGWIENCALFMALIGRPGVNKSHPLSLALSPLDKMDEKNHEQYKRDMEEYKQYLELSNEEKKAQGLPEMQKPVSKKFLLDDVTQEAVISIHENNPRGIGINSEELGKWLKSFNRYNSGGEEDFWISAWSGKKIAVDRNTKEPKQIFNPFISVIGTTHPKVLGEMTKDHRLNNGFFDRFLLTFPEDIAKPYWNEKEMGDEVYASYEDVIVKLANLTYTPDCESNAIMTYSPEAKDVVMEWQKCNADQYNEVEDDKMQEILSKSEVYINRLALIMEVMFQACEDIYSHEVKVRSVNAAIQLTEYFKSTARKVYSFVNDPLKDLNEKKKEVYRNLPEQFNTQTGVEVAENLGMKERSFKDFLKKQDYFRNLDTGKWAKKV